MAKKIESTIEKIAKELLEHLEVEAEIKVAQDKEGLATVFIKTEEPGVLIGYHGQTLDAIQLLLLMMVYRQLGEWTRILVEVNDYRQKRKESLERLALSLAQRAKFSGESQVLPPMSSFERRVIHLALAEDPEVETVSEGEEPERKVVVKPAGEGSDPSASSRARPPGLPPALLRNAKRAGRPGEVGREANRAGK